MLLSTQTGWNVSMPAKLVSQSSQIPVAIWFVGAAVLGLVMTYGILRTRNRTRAEKQITEQATKQVYAEEEDGLEARMCK